ncbi:MAG: 4-hydroxy-tetrahydrodipicolinate synthase [Candidatus Thorarchaeota archaeon]|nr:4-hydroxy-tetrahydrodipicolinate synthase [Candidatus Thorarchaeota archaeon]
MTKRFEPSGVMPALVTPFTKDGDLIEEGFKQVIDYTISKGATGVVPAGTTGEFVYMRTEERKRLLKLCVEFTDGRVPVIAGTGQNSTQATIALTKYAADVGCDAALVVSPYYLRPTDKGYYEHYEAVARRGDLPVILYNIPQCTLGVLSSSLVEDLAELDNIVGIKDSSGSIPHVLELIQKVGNKIPVLIGHDECFLSAISAGAKAAILASANVIPHIWLKIMEHVKAGKMKEAASLQHSVQTLSRIITRNGGAPPVKAALRMMGIKAGKSRLPLDTGGTLTPELRDEIGVELEKLGLVEKMKSTPLDKALDIMKLMPTLGVEFSATQGVSYGKGVSNAVSVSIAVGPKDSSLGLAFVRLLARPKIGHEALTVILEPNLAVRPSSIMVPARPIASMRQASLFYGPVQSGAAKAVADHLARGLIPAQDVEHKVIVMAIDVDLNMRDRRMLTASAREAVSLALSQVWR